MKKSEIIDYLKDDHPSSLTELYARADGVRKEYMGDGILLRGIVEFSSFCKNTCSYCGLNKNNTHLDRFRLTKEQILESVGRIAGARIKTVVLQSGEDDEISAGWLAAVVKDIKARYDMAITLSVGERPRADYQCWRDAGADRYLLKIETANPALYAALHPQMDFNNRLRCLEDVRACGYQVGCGAIVGLKDQTIDDIAGDIVFFSENNFDMIGIGPFIPHAATVLGGEQKGGVALTIKAVALTRIATGTAHLPATTALGSVGEKDYRIDALKAGANVLMPNFTPKAFKKRYEIYPGKRCVDEDSEHCVGCMQALAASIGRHIDYSRGDALKTIVSVLR
ncbi:MAG: [FeFe] hydrogenase H-cluster radical SAM maturase HydE [Elusimicrobiota bacterium]